MNRVVLAFAWIALVLFSGCSLGTDRPAYSSKEDTGVSDEPPSQTDERALRYRLTAAPLQEAALQSRQPSPFRLLASGSKRARIVGSDRNVVRSAPSDGTIFSFKLSPGQQWLLLYFGSAKYSIASSESMEDIVKPPASPEGFDDATGFSWWILDDAHLIGQADLPSVETEGLTASEKDSLPPRATLIYLFTISSGTMAPVEIDDTLPPVFFIHEVYDGQVSLLTLDGNMPFGAKIVQMPEL